MPLTKLFNWDVFLTINMLFYIIKNLVASTKYIFLYCYVDQIILLLDFMYKT